MGRTVIDDVATIGDEPIVRVGSRFLPVPATLLPPLPDTADGILELTVPAGTPVYAVEAGRVLQAEGVTVGEVIVRGENGTRFHYRRMTPSTVTVTQGQAVDAGSVLGLVAPAHAGSTLGFGIQDSDGTWEDAAKQLVGLADPSELFLLPPTPGDAGLVAELPSQRRPARTAPRAATVERTPTPQPAPPTLTSAGPPSVTPAPTPAPERAPDPEPTPASDPMPEPASAEAPRPTPTPGGSAADRLTRPRRRGGSGTSEAAPPAPAPAPEPTPVPEPPPPAADEPPDVVPVDSAVTAPDLPESSDAEDESPTADDARASALVSRRRRPGGKR